MSDEETLPPRTPRTYLRRAWGWLLAHPMHAAALAAFVCGFVLGRAL